MIRVRPSQSPNVCQLVFLVVGVGFQSGCGPSPPAAPKTSSAANQTVPTFDNIAAAVGLDFSHQVELSGNYLFSESMASGGAFLDFDNDGRLDAYLIHNVGSNATGLAINRLFHQQPDGRFKDVSAGSGLEQSSYGNGLAVGDLNNDGLPEVLVTEYERVRLFLNEGRGHFRDVTDAAGITNAHWSIPAAFFDYDRDGWLDLVLGNYLDFDPSQKCPDARGRVDFCGPHGFPATTTRLFRNVTGRRVSVGKPVGRAELKFEDVTVASGLVRVPGKAMGIVCADFNGDHWPDVMVADDELPNRLFVNQRNGTFLEEAVRRGLAYTGTGATAANMGIALGDVDGDGRFEVFVPHLTEENHTLWRQSSPGIFQDVTAAAGLLTLPWHGTGFGAVLGDLNNDGALDLAVANGRIRRGPARNQLRVLNGLPAFWVPYAEPAQLFVNDGAGRFQEVSEASPVFCGEALVGRGLLCGDVDNDGALDLLVTGIAAPARLFHNTTKARGHWLGIRAVEPVLGNRDAYGAELEIRAGRRKWWRLLQPAYSYASSNDPRVHVGLGSAAMVDEIRVVWPDGAEETFPGGAVDRYLVLQRGSGVKAGVRSP